MFSYICLGTNDPARTARFYDAVLGALGQRRCEVSAEWESAGWRGWGTYEREPDFYAAYVRDPDGNKLAAVCRGFTQPQES
jgi:hypothetical protein